MGDVSLPMGILGGVNGQSRMVHLAAGDYAVLVSDGLLVDGPGWWSNSWNSQRRRETRRRKLPERWWRPPGPGLRKQAAPMTSRRRCCGWNHVEIFIE